MRKTTDVRPTIGCSRDKGGTSKPRAVSNVSPKQITYSTFSVERVARLVLQHYGLGDSVHCALFARAMNDIYLICVGERRFALRVSRSDGNSKRAIEAELRALKHLGNRGAPVALPVSRIDGTCITEIQAPEGCRCVVLFNWVDGRTPKLSDPRHALLYGRHLAQLHSASDEMPLERARTSMDLKYLLHHPVRNIRPKLEQWPDLAQRLDCLVERLVARLSHDDALSLDTGFCHGDIHSGNARIDGDRVISFDFDTCGAGWRIYDLASYKWEARRRGVEREAWHHFLEGYLELRPAAAEALALVDVFVILRHLWLSSEWILLCDVIGHGLLSEGFFESIVPFCEEIESGIPSPPQSFYVTWPRQQSIA